MSATMTRTTADALIAADKIVSASVAWRNQGSGWRVQRLTIATNITPKWVSLNQKGINHG